MSNAANRFAATAKAAGVRTTNKTVSTGLYRASMNKFILRFGVSEKEGVRKPWANISFSVKLLSEAAKEELGREEVVIRSGDKTKGFSSFFNIADIGFSPSENPQLALLCSKLLEAGGHAEKSTDDKGEPTYNWADTIWDNLYGDSEELERTYLEEANSSDNADAATLVPYRLAAAQLQHMSDLLTANSLTCDVVVKVAKTKRPDGSYENFVENVLMPAECSEEILKEIIA